MLTIQFLEPGSHLAAISPEAARAKLQAAFDLLPIDGVLLGWRTPAPLEDACREVSARAGAKLYRWHPLLCGDGDFNPRQEWRTRNLSGVALPGFRGLPEFTFVCPNHPAARAAALEHLTTLAASGRYDGFFLDRMRFPSPAADPLEKMACFCDHCCQAAEAAGLDLRALRRDWHAIAPLNLLGMFFGREASQQAPLAAFFDFRQQSITRFVSEAAAILRNANLAVGLDCFAPMLTPMVGQNLAALASLADWTKIMLYGHAYGPATLPYELLHLADWLLEQEQLPAPEAMELLCELTGFTLPAECSDLRAQGISPENLASEVERARKSVPGTLLAGIELVEIPGVAELNNGKISADLRAFRQAGADGLSLSWDLWFMPLQRLELVRAAWVD